MHMESGAKRIVHILPFYGMRMWGGTRLKEEFGYETEVDPLGEVYNVVALRDHADCLVKDESCTLAELYERRPDWFDCDTQELPVRVNILDPVEDLSIQLHPGDDYAAVHGGSRGKPEAWVILDAPEGGYIVYGHYAKSLDEFKQLFESGQYQKLFRYIPAKKDWFLDIPAGMLHAIGKHVLTYNISRNADCTYRLYDYDRIDPRTGAPRELSIAQVYDNLRIPGDKEGFIQFEPSFRDGCEITEYWDEPGLYTLKRLRIREEGSFDFDRFAFYTIVEGSGTICDFPVKKGDTVLVPHQYGRIEIKGALDMFLASYRNP